MGERGLSSLSALVALWIVWCCPSILLGQSTDKYNVEINCDAQYQLLDKLKTCASLVQAKKGVDAFKKHEQKVSEFVRSVPGFLVPSQAKIGVAIVKSMAALADLSAAVGSTIFDGVIPNLRNQIYGLDQIVKMHGGYEVDCCKHFLDRCVRKGKWNEAAAERCCQQYPCCD
jgi:hypothetical protein